MVLCVAVPVPFKVPANLLGNPDTDHAFKLGAKGREVGQLETFWLDGRPLPPLDWGAGYRYIILFS